MLLVLPVIFQYQNLLNQPLILQKNKKTFPLLWFCQYTGPPKPHGLYDMEDKLI